MQFTASQIAMIIQGKVEGDASTAITSFGKIEEAVDGQLSFLANPKYEEYLYNTKASIVIINDTQELKSSVKAVIIRVPDAYSAFATLMTKYQQLAAQLLKGIEQPNYISSTTKIGQNVYFGAFSYAGEKVQIGDDSKIYPGVFLGNGVIIGKHSIIHAGVKIYNDCIIGDHVIIHAGTVLGSDGFGFAPQSDGSYIKIPQLGNVVLEDFVEIGANCTIDRATMGSTIIRKGTKLDNLIQIAHNVEIGNNTVIAAQAGISGSTKVGNGVMIGGQVGTAGHIVIADGSKIAGQAGVTKSIKVPNRTHNGTPAFDFSSSLRIQALTRSLPEMEKRVKELEKLIEQLISKRDNT